MIKVRFGRRVAENKACGAFLGRWRLTVVEGDYSCRAARRLMHDWADERLWGSWSCTGPESAVVCTKERGASSGVVIMARFASEAAAVEAANNNRLSDEQLITRRGNEWAPLFAEGGYAPSPCRYMGQPACERMGCQRVGHPEPIKNCTPVSAEFRESFADATVERVRVQDHCTYAAFTKHCAYAEFTNGESVEFQDIHSAWFITETWIKNTGRR